MTIPETIFSLTGERDSSFDVGEPDQFWEDKTPTPVLLGFQIAISWDVLLFSLELDEVKALRDALTKWIEEQEAKR